MLNLLIYDAPTRLDVCGIELEIYTDFREFIELDELLTSSDDQQILIYILELYKDLPEGLDLDSLVSAVMGFFRMDEEENKKAGEDSKNPVFSFSEDMPYILSGFRQYYSIDLMHIDYMHWWEFMALLIGLPEDSELKKRIGYRSIDLSKIKEKAERKRIRKIQASLKIRRRSRRYMTDVEIGAVFG